MDLLVGTVGLDVDTWQDGFYDQDLPPDWRPASYSTLLRSVLLPQEEWRRAVEQCWADEVDDGFSFVLQLDAAAGVKAEFEHLCREISALPADFFRLVAAVIVQIPPGLDLSRWQSAIKNLRRQFTLCLDPGPVDLGATTIGAQCETAGLACAWYPATQAAPLPSGDFLAVYITDESLRQQRDIITALGLWMQDSRGAGIYNQHPGDAPTRAQETRQLAEIMGI